MTEPELTAHHEAAHAVAAFIFRRSPQRAWIGRDGVGGITTMTLRRAARGSMPEERWRELAFEEAQICIAGPIAEHIQTGEVDARACRNDFHGVEAWLRDLGFADPLARQTLILTTKSLLSEKRTWAAVRTIAARLLRDGSLGGDELTEICHAMKVPRDHRAARE
jgi:hypothetical protein